MENRDRNDALLIVGVVVLLIGMLALGRTLDIFPPFMLQAFRMAMRATGPLALIVLGIIVILIATRGGISMPRPVPGTRLYRSRSDRMVAGVAGGLARYLQIDPLLVRLAIVVLVLANAPGVVIAYIILAVLVPEEPVETVPPAQGGDQPSV